MTAPATDAQATDALTTDERAGDALARMAVGYNCAQSVLAAFAPGLGLPVDAALRLACGFGAGMARRQETCGAVSGAIAVLGLRHGRGEGAPKAATETTYARVRALMEGFEARRGSCCCRTLLQGHDLTTPEGRQAILKADLIHTTCVACVRDAVELTESLL